MPDITITRLTPMLYTRDIPGTIDFYVKVLGFECGSYAEEWAWASLSRDGVEIMLAHPNEHMPFDKPNFTGSFYFNTPDVDAFWTRVKDSTEIVYGLENFEYGMREFAIYDNNGYVLQFGTAIG